MLRPRLSIAALTLVLAAAAAHAQDLSELSDSFDDNERLGQWKRLAEEEGFPSRIRDIGLHADTGCLHLEPDTGLWVRDFRAPFVFKDVQGDFVVTTRLLLRGKRFGIPMTRWCMAGLLARGPRDVTVDTWTAGGENWLSLMTGTESTIRKQAVEVRSTTDSETERWSQRLGRGWTWMELRMARVGSEFVFLAHREEEPWMVVGRVDRPDLPSSLQVGLAACDGWMTVMPLHDDPVAFNTQPIDGHPDVEVLFDYAHFSRPSVPDGLQLTDPSVSDEQVLQLFVD
jgi:hypothetical protein